MRGKNGANADAFASILTMQWRKNTHPKRVRILTQLLKGILDTDLDSPNIGLFMFGEVCTVDGHSDFGNLMLSKLIITPKE